MITRKKDFLIPGTAEHRAGNENAVRKELELCCDRVVEINKNECEGE